MSPGPGPPSTRPGQIQVVSTRLPRTGGHAHTFLREAKGGSNFPRYVCLGRPRRRFEQEARRGTAGRVFSGPCPEGGPRRPRRAGSGLSSASAPAKAAPGPEWKAAKRRRPQRRTSAQGVGVVSVVMGVALSRGVWEGMGAVGGGPRNASLIGPPGLARRITSRRHSD